MYINFRFLIHFCIVFLSESHRLIAPNLAGHKKRHLILNIFFCHLMLNILLVSFFNNKIKNLQKSCFQKSEQISSNCSLSIYFLSHLYSSTTTYPLYMVIYIKPLLFNQLISWYWNLKHVTDDMAYTYGRHMVNGLTWFIAYHCSKDLSINVLQTEDIWMRVLWF